MASRLNTMVILSTPIQEILLPARLMVKGLAISGLLLLQIWLPIVGASRLLPVVGTEVGIKQIESTS
jgi:hypothetical protein